MSPTPLPAAPLKRRFAALVYESLLIGAVTCAAFVPAGIIALFLNRVSPPLSALAVSLVLVYAWWLYFKTNWHKKGQTLAMRPAAPALYLGVRVSGFRAAAGLCRAASGHGRAAEGGVGRGALLVDTAVGFCPV